MIEDAMPQRTIPRAALGTDHAPRATSFAAAADRFERRMYSAVALSTAITIGALGLIIALT